MSTRPHVGPVKIHGSPGGARPGAGRPKGVPNSKPSRTAAVVMAAMEQSGGLTPLEVMLRTMRGHWDEAELLLGEAADAVDADDAAKLRRQAGTARSAACQQAREAAPYVHVRVTATQLSGAGGAPLPATVMIYLPDNGREADAVQAATGTAD